MLTSQQNFKLGQTKLVISLHDNRYNDKHFSIFWNRLLACLRISKNWYLEFWSLEILDKILKFLIKNWVFWGKNACCYIHIYAMRNLILGVLTWNSTSRTSINGVTCETEYFLFLLSFPGAKGQTNSKWFFQVDVSSKKRTNKFDFPTWQLVFVRFLGESKDTKKTVRNWLTFN